MPWRQSIHIPNVSHGNQPIPFACKVGNMVFTGAIMGRNPDGSAVPDDAESQAANCFKNLETTMKVAGGSVADVGFMTVFIKSGDVRPAVNKAWLEMFPDENNRPARHTVIQENLNYHCQIECIAVLQG